MKTLCPLRFGGAESCGCGASHATMAKYGRELRERSKESEGGESREDTLNRLLKAGVPVALCSALKGQWDKTEALGAARRFMAEKASALYLSGSPGVGKSFAGAWCLYELARAYAWDSQPSGYGVREPLAFAKAFEVGGMSRFDVGDSDRLELLAMARLLLVDDLGQEGNGEGRTRLAELLCDRIDQRRPTVITSNLTAAGALAQLYGTRLEDRLRGAIRPKLESKSKRSGKEWRRGVA